MKYEDRIGKKFGRLTILSYNPKNHRGRYVCQCECGKIKEVDSSQLVSGRIRSCGCLARELTSQRSIGNKYSSKHQKNKTRLYQIWLDMKQRCYNPKQKVYKWYGAKGIKICDEWLDSYTTFEKWCLENGYSETLTIDRINSKGNYEPNNCRWVDTKTQARNKKSTILITHNGKTQCLKDWCIELNKNYPTIVNRIHNGWQPKAALLVPKNIRRGGEQYEQSIASIN